MRPIRFSVNGIRRAFATRHRGLEPGRARRLGALRKFKMTPRDLLAVRRRRLESTWLEPLTHQIANLRKRKSERLFEEFE